MKEVLVGHPIRIKLHDFGLEKAMGDCVVMRIDEYAQDPD